MLGLSSSLVMGLTMGVHIDYIRPIVVILFRFDEFYCISDFTVMRPNTSILTSGL